MENRQRVWRDGLASLLSTAGLQSLKWALLTDYPRLLQGATTTPPPLPCTEHWPVEAACALGYCGWLGDQLMTVVEVEQFFARKCFETDERLGEPVAIRWFLNWFDEAPQNLMRHELLAEVSRALVSRGAETVEEAGDAGTVAA